MNYLYTYKLNTNLLLNNLKTFIKKNLYLSEEILPLSMKILKLEKLVAFFKRNNKYRLVFKATIFLNFQIFIDKRRIFPEKPDF